MVGAGYGGYLVLASLASHGERIHAAVEMDGLIDLVACLGDEHGGDRSEYGDERVEATRTWLASISPRAWVGRLETPLLVVEGAQGPSSMEQSLQADLPALRKRGVEVWYMRIDDGGSALRRNESRDYLEAVVASFWRTRLTARQPR